MSSKGNADLLGRATPQAVALANAIDDLLRRHVDQVVSEFLKRIGGRTPADIRIQQGLSLKQLAIKSSIAASMLSNIEGGRVRNPRPETIERITGVLPVGTEEYRRAITAVFNDRKAREEDKAKGTGGRRRSR